MKKASGNKGKWRSHVFKCEDHKPLDLEIGTGNGFHFAQLTKTHPQRNFIGLELKYKPLVQSIRRSLRAQCTNSRMARFHAHGVGDLFGPGEINNVYIHFPDPWPKKRHHKNRLIQPLFLSHLYQVMREGGFVEFKTDNHPYFQWAIRCFRESPFVLSFFTENLHQSFRRNQNFVTHFESLFLAKGQPIHCCRLQKTRGDGNYLQ